MAQWYRRVFILAIPLILSNLTQPLLSTVDTVLSGHLPGAAALGGVAIAGIFFNGVFWTFSFLRMATTGLVAQAYGARQNHALRLHFARAMLLTVVIAALVVALRGPLIAGAIYLLSAGPDVAQNARIYCHIRIWSSPAALANYVILGMLLGRQRARTALLIQAAINVVNVGVALYLVVELHWGVAGIATATVAADYAGLAMGLVITLQSGVLSRGDLPGQPIRWSEVLDGENLRHLFALNFNLFLRTISMVAAYGWFTRSGARAGDAVLAANAVLLNLHNMAAYGLDGFANATETLVGQAIGAQRLADYRAVLRASTLAAAVVAVLISCAYLAFGPALVRLFSSDPTVRALAMRYLPWAVAMPILSVWAFQMDGVFVGATRGADLRNSMFVSFAIYFVLAVALEHSFGNSGLWCALALFMVLRGVTLGVRLPGIERSFLIAVS